MTKFDSNKINVCSVVLCIGTQHVSPLFELWYVPCGNKCLFYDTLHGNNQCYVLQWIIPMGLETVPRAPPRLDGNHDEKYNYE